MFPFIRFFSFSPDQLANNSKLGFSEGGGLEEGGAETVLSTEGAALMNSMREKKICFLNMKERASVKAQALNKIGNL